MADFFHSRVRTRIDARGVRGCLAAVPDRTLSCQDTRQGGT